MTFQKLGFKTGKVILPGIDLVVELDHNKYFKNDGIVQNIDQHFDNLGKIFDFSNSNYERNSYAGIHIPLYSDEKKVP